MSHPYSNSQRDFIVSIRKQIDQNPRFFDENNWSNIVPKGGRNSSLLKAIYHDSFYVRPIAAYVPHLLFNETPCCPHCGSRRHVNINSARWINSPKILYGMGTHKYLDTMLYPCNGCKRHFAGYDKVSMGHDQDRTIGFFNMKLSKRFAVDEELFSFIISSWKTPVAVTRQQLEDIATRKYLSDYKYYLHALRAKKIKMRRLFYDEEDPTQPTVRGHFNNREVSVTEKTLSQLRSNMMKAKLRYQSALNTANSSIPFYDLMNVKSDNNNSDRMLKKLGKKKLENLIECGIKSGRALAQYEGVSARWNKDRHTRNTFYGWQDMVRCQFDNWEDDANHAKLELQGLEDLVKAQQEALDVENLVLAGHLDGGPDEDDGPVDEPVEESTDPKFPAFSKMKDVKGYNARILSAARIESLLMTDFMNRKKLMQSKMMSQESVMCKMDFTYKIPGKVNVYKGVGDCFKPYKSMFVLQNEKNQTVYWKCLSGSESIQSVAKGLTAFKEANPKTVKVIWVDNCCNIRDKLKSIFPEAETKLDIFHWTKRWDPLLLDTKSEEASIFRGLMKRATFNVPPGEYDDAKSRVRKKLQRSKKLPAGAEPTHRQIMKEARTVVPPPKDLRDSVMAVLRYCMMFDTGIEIRKLNRGDDNSELPKPFFKAFNADRRKIMANQMSHVDKGCLSDPEGFDIHHVNPETGNITCCRGTNSIENDNLYLDNLTGKAIGIAKADRLITTFFEMGNDRKRISRLGQQQEWSDLFTARTEELALINSMMASVGFSEDQYAFKVSNPPEIEDRVVPELGFDVSVSVTEGTLTGDVLIGSQKDAQEAGGSSDVDYDEDEDGNHLLNEAPAAPATGEEAIQPTQADPLTEDMALAEFLDEIDLAGEVPESTERKVKSLECHIFKPETTMEAFIRLTNQQEWVPFNHSSNNKSAEEEEEFSLFETMSTKFNRHVSPSAHRGYKAFEKAWNLEVAKRYLEALEEGDNNILFIKRKSCNQLLDHFDWLQSRLRSSERAEESKDDSMMTDLNKELRAVRNSVPRLPPVATAVPVSYQQDPARPMATGAPLTFNAEVIAQGLVIGPYRNPAPWRLATPQPLAARQPNNPLTGMNIRKWCRTCGFQKANHTKEEGFGAKCKRDWCSKCHKLKKYHLVSKGKMGPFCTEEPHHASLHNLWYA